MVDLLLEQEREINECLKTHLCQMMNACALDRTVDWKKIFAYLTLLMEYECFIFAINKENFDMMQNGFDLILKIMADSRESLNEEFKSCSETQIKKLNIMFFKFPSNEYFGDNVEIESEKEKDGQNSFNFNPLPIAKVTLKNFREILEST